jgi:hypothetical protein
LGLPRSDKYKCVNSLKSFLFTLKNRHNTPARRFALKAEKKQRAIYCDSRDGPYFGGIHVCDNCNAHTDSWTSLGFVSTNDTGLDGKTVFTGSHNFKVREIEVFEITDEITLPNNLLAFPRFCSDRAKHANSILSANRIDRTVFLKERSAENMFAR